MKNNFYFKLIFLLLILLSTFVFTQKVESGYQRYGQVLEPSINSWDSIYIKMPAIILDRSIYKMLYSGYGSNHRWQIGLAYSLDGINWIKFVNPVKTRLTYDNRDTHDPTWFYDSSTNSYEMWYASSINGGQNDFKIYHSTSNNGLEWTNDFDTLVYSGTQNWESNGVSCPFVLKTGNKYYMWYSGRNSSWKIGVLTSNDGLNWTPYQNNPIITTTQSYEYSELISPEVIYENSNNQEKFLMWYTSNNVVNSHSIAYAESTDGFIWSKPSDNPVLLKSGIDGTFDKYGIAEPSVYKNNQNILLWYSGVYLNSKGIGLAYQGEAPIPQPLPSGSLFPTDTPNNTPTIIPSPSPTITPSQTPSPSPSPTLSPKTPIVIIPGMFTSWNKEILLENKPNSTKPWRLMPFIKEYEGIIQTLEHLGYTKNETLFLWPYNWSQSIEQTVKQFDSYLSSTVFSQPNSHSINLIGHSLGGLVARAWAQEGSNKNKISHLITVGSPNQGVIQPYLAWEGGDLTFDNTSISLAANIIVHIAKKSFQTNKDVIQKYFPILGNLLPSSPYLLREKTLTQIEKNQMYVWNNWLETLNTQTPSIYNIFDSIAGININTPSQFVVSSPSKLDFLLGNWQDGKPIETKYSSGDGTVPVSRSIFIDDASIQLSKGHGELIASKEGIEKILQLLSIPYSANDLHEGSLTSFAPGLLFLLRSPATMTVTSNTATYRDYDGIIYIPNAPAGNYTVTVSGTDNGIYTLSVGQIDTTSVSWKDVINTTTINQHDQFSFVYYPNINHLIQFTNWSDIDYYNQIAQQLTQMEQSLSLQTRRRFQIELFLLKNAIDKHSLFLKKHQLEQLIHITSTTLSGATTEQIYTRMKMFDYCKEYYLYLFNNLPEYFQEKRLQHQIKQANAINMRIESLIDKKKPKHINILFYQHALEHLSKAKLMLTEHHLANASIELFICQVFFDMVIQ